MNNFYITPQDDDNNDSIIIEDTDDETDTTDETLVSSDEDDEYSIDTEECETILNDDYQHNFAEKQDKHYYLGSCWKQDDKWTMTNSVSARVFYRHSFLDIIHYLWLFSLVRMSSPHIHILQLRISQDGTYNVIIKTFWLRIVQRTWKRIYRERQEIWQKRRNIMALRQREITGKFPVGLRVLPKFSSTAPMGLQGWDLRSPTGSLRLPSNLVVGGVNAP